MLAAVFVGLELVSAFIVYACLCVSSDAEDELLEMDGLRIGK